MGSILHLTSEASPTGTKVARLAAFAAALLALVAVHTAHAQWTQTNGPAGADVRAFAFSGSDVYAGTGSGVFYSSNTGASWTNAGLITTSITALATNGSVLYAGSFFGVYASSNRGASWSSAGLGSEVVRSLAVSGSKLYAGTDGKGIYLSRDGGANWNGISAFLPDSTILALLPLGSALLAGSNFGYIWRTTNEGSSWVDVSSDLSTVSSVNALYAFGSVLYAATDDGIWRSTDSAAHWIQLGLSGADVVAVGASATNIYAGTLAGFYVSSNGGSTWISYSSGLDNPYINALAPFGATVLVGTSSSGIYRSTNSGSAWTESNNGLIGQLTWSLAATPLTGPQALFAGSGDGVSVSLDRGASWLRLNIGLPPTTVFSLQLSDTNLFAGTRAGVFRGTLNGISWTPASTGLPFGHYVYSLARVPPSGGTNPTLFAGTGYGIYFSTNLGASWNSTSLGISGIPAVLSLAAQSSGGNTNIYAGTWGLGVYKSTNNGSSWTAAGTGVQAGATISVIKAIGTNLFLGTYGFGAYISTDNGGSWTGINNGLPPSPWVYAFAAVGSSIYAGVAGGVYISTNNGASWTLDNTGLVGHDVVSLEVSGPTVFAGTTRGVWSLVKSSSYPTSYALSTTFQFPQHTSISDFSTADYRLVGLPGNPGTSVSGYLTGKTETNWRVTWDNGGTSNYLVRYDGSSTFNFTTGRAFWMINNGPVTISATVPTATLNANTEAEVPLHSGWNLITNPFSADVAWANLQSHNSVTEPIFQYNGTSTYLTPTILSPYTGYYFYNSTGIATLKIPLSYAGVVPVGRTGDPAAWRVQLWASDGMTADSMPSFGVLAGPADRAKALSYHRPRSMDEGVSVSFPRPDLDPKFPAYAADIRPVFENIQEWPVEFTGKQGKPAMIGFSGLQKVPLTFEAWLVDEQSGRAFDLRKDSVYAFTPPLARSRFSVVIGRHGFVQARLASGLPTAFGLGRNFPNPFNPSTTIPVEVPRETQASLKVYSLLGAEVAVLHQGPLEAGRYWFTWNGLDRGGQSAATGAYLVRLQAGGKSFVTKILLLR